MHDRSCLRWEYQYHSPPCADTVRLAAVIATVERRFGCLTGEQAMYVGAGEYLLQTGLIDEAALQRTRLCQRTRNLADRGLGIDDRFCRALPELGLVDPKDYLKALAALYEVSDLRNFHGLPVSPGFVHASREGPVRELPVLPLYQIGMRMAFFFAAFDGQEENIPATLREHLGIRIHVFRNQAVATDELREDLYTTISSLPPLSLETISHEATASFREDAPVDYIRNDSFLERAKKQGLLQEDEAERLYKRFVGNALAILRFMYHVGLGEKRQLGQLWGDTLGVAYTSMDKTLFDPSSVHLFPVDSARKNHVILPFRFGDAVTAAMVNPQDKQLLQRIERITGKTVDPVFSLPEEIASAIEIQYTTPEALCDLAHEILGELPAATSAHKTSALLGQDAKHAGEEEPLPEVLEEVADEEPEQAVLFGEPDSASASRHRLSGRALGVAILLNACREQSTCIWFRPEGDDVTVLLNEGAGEHELATIPARSARLALQALTEMGHSAPAPARHTGRCDLITLSLPDRVLQYGIVGDLEGDSSGVRIQQIREERHTLVPDLEDLGMPRKLLKKVRAFLSEERGVLLLSGAAAHLRYRIALAVLKAMKGSTDSVFLLNNPPVGGEVDAEAYRKSLLSYLNNRRVRVMVGDVRSAADAALAGSVAEADGMSLAVIEAPSAPHALQRFCAFRDGLPDAPVFVLCMDEVQELCDACKVDSAFDEEELGEFFQPGQHPPVRIFRTKGCSQCGDTGYGARMPLFESLFASERVRQALKSHAADPVEACEFEQSYRSSEYQGLKMVLKGRTSFDEIRRLRNMSETSVS